METSQCLCEGTRRTAIASYTMRQFVHQINLYITTSDQTVMKHLNAQIDEIVISLQKYEAIIKRAPDMQLFCTWDSKNGTSKRVAKKVNLNAQFLHFVNGKPEKVSRLYNCV